MLRTFRKRLSRHPATIAAAAAPMALYLRLAALTGRWRIEGQDTLAAALREGPVVLVFWHERLAMGGVHWPFHAGPVAALHSTSPIGRIAGRIEASFGVTAVAMADGASGLATTRDVMRGLKAGRSVAVPADGPLGPARRVKDPALDWARASGAPVFLYAWASRRQRRLDTWDRLALPRLFDGGHALFVPFEAAIPRRLDDTAREDLRSELGAALDRAVAEAEARCRP